MSVKTKSLEERLASHPELKKHLLTLLELAGARKGAWFITAAKHGNWTTHGPSD